MEVLQSGAPPHGGIALGKQSSVQSRFAKSSAGFDRLLAMLCRSSSLRDVIAFPKSAEGVDPLFRAPSDFKLTE